MCAVLIQKHNWAVMTLRVAPCLLGTRLSVKAGSAWSIYLRKRAKRLGRKTHVQSCCVSCKKHIADVLPFVPLVGTIHREHVRSVALFFLGIYVHQHSLGTTWKPPEDLCKWLTKYSKGPGSFPTLVWGRELLLRGSLFQIQHSCGSKNRYLTWETWTKTCGPLAV